MSDLNQQMTRLLEDLKAATNQEASDFGERVYALSSEMAAADDYMRRQVEALMTARSFRHADLVGKLKDLLAAMVPASPIPPIESRYSAPRPLASDVLRQLVEAAE